MQSVYDNQFCIHLKFFSVNHLRNKLAIPDPIWRQWNSQLSWTNFMLAILNLISLHRFLSATLDPIFELIILFSHLYLFVKLKCYWSHRCGWKTPTWQVPQKQYCCKCILLSKLHFLSSPNLVVVIDKLDEFHTTNGEVVRFKCWRNAPGDCGSLFVSELNFLYRSIVSQPLCSWHFLVFTSSNQHECNDNNAWMIFALSAKLSDYIVTS